MSIAMENLTNIHFYPGY